MNEELQKQLAESIKSFSSSIGQAKEFAVEQAPDIIQQYIYWGMASSVISIIVSIFVIWLSYMIACKWVDQKPDFSGNLSIEKVFSVIFGAGASAGSFLFIIANIFELAKIIIAPKVWLIQQAASLIK